MGSGLLREAVRAEQLAKTRSARFGWEQWLEFIKAKQYGGRTVNFRFNIYSRSDFH